jgi:hypothetical protein
MPMNGEQEVKAFSTFRVLNGDANIAERDQLFRNMGQLFSYVSDRCDDDQVAQYDNVLCQLADLVEIEARTHVAQLLARLDRAPGMVVVKLAHDAIEVAQPLLEFSKVLTDDDLIDIISTASERHRAAIAGRKDVGERVGQAIVEHGNNNTIIRLVRNESAQLNMGTLEQIVLRAADDSAMAADLRNRRDIDWRRLSQEMSGAGAEVARQLRLTPVHLDTETVRRASAVAYSRLRNRGGFDSQEWKLAINQVKALNDRQQLNNKALLRFARFGYGHHAAAGLTIMLHLPTPTLVKWLAAQDYAALIIAMRSLDFDVDGFTAIFQALPWRDMPTREDCEVIRARFDALSAEEGNEIFATWRNHAFRRRGGDHELAGVA